MKRREFLGTVAAGMAAGALPVAHHRRTTTDREKIVARMMELAANYDRMIAGRDLEPGQFVRYVGEKNGRRILA